MFLDFLGTLVPVLNAVLKTYQVNIVVRSSEERLQQHACSRVHTMLTCNEIKVHRINGFYFFK